MRQEAIAALKASSLRYGDIFMPGSLANAADGTRGTVMFFGGANWWGGRADPETGFVYVSSATSPFVIALRPNTLARCPRPAVVEAEVAVAAAVWRRNQVQSLAPLRRPPACLAPAVEVNKDSSSYHLPASAPAQPAAPRSISPPAPWAQ